jgi:uncharacterized protein (TIGR02145 family)
MKNFLLLIIVLLFATSFKNHDARVVVAKDFPSITIGNQTWMTQNWDYKTPKSFYFDNDSATNYKYGRLYFFSNATAAAPPGWHLPTLDEWQELINHFGGNEIALTSLLDGGTSGINLLYGGNKSANISPTDIFNFKGEWGFYWTSTTDGDQTAYAIHFEKGKPAITTTTYRRANGFSVRYIRDK